MSYASFALRRSSIAMPFMAMKGTTDAICTLTSSNAPSGSFPFTEIWAGGIWKTRSQPRAFRGCMSKAL